MTLPFPILVEPAYTLNAEGRTVAYDSDELLNAIKRGMDLSPIREIRLTKATDRALKASKGV